jgi:hypothetical protein
MQEFKGNVRKRRGCLPQILGLLFLGLAVVYGVAGLTSPWSFHIGGRWTPLLYWSGMGKLVSKNGTYPLYLYFYPDSHFSRLHVDGLNPTGGLQGAAWLCTSTGMVQHLKLSGTIFGGWRSTEGSLMSFRLLDWKLIDMGQRQGFVDLYGRWQGPELVMDDRARVGEKFRFGMKLEHASVVLHWGSYSDFQEVCKQETNFAPPR